MRTSLTQKLILLAILVGHLAIQCDTSILPTRNCRRWNRWGRRCRPFRMPVNNLCSMQESICSSNGGLSDCLLPHFQCVLNSRCILRKYLCNGFPDCSDGSDEWGCETTSDSTNTNTMRLESVESTSSYTATVSIILHGQDGKTINMILSGDNTLLFPPPSPPPTTIITMLPHSESNSAFSSSTRSTTFPNSESNTAFSSSTKTGTMLPHSESNAALSSSTRSTTFPNSESNTAFSSSTKTGTILFGSEMSTDISSSPKTRTRFPNSESSIALPSSATTETIPFRSETSNAISSSTTSKTLLPTLRETNTILSEPRGNTLSPTTNTFPEPSAIQSCPDNYCMQNAECIVVQGQYRCKCPSSFVGELCEIQLESERSSREYAVVIASSIALVFLCLAVGSVCIYRYKRLSSWKSRDMTSRTLSQLTLTSSAVE